VFHENEQEREAMEPGASNFITKNIKEKEKNKKNKRVKGWEKSACMRFGTNFSDAD